MATYHYINSADYINKLDFAYFETWSLQRGESFLATQARLDREYEALEQLKKRNNGLTTAEETRLAELADLSKYTQLIVNEKGTLHPSAVKIKTFQRHDAEAIQLVNILQTEIIQKPALLCAPEYRDAIIFYNSRQERISTLNICFECLYMETALFHHVNADFSTYDLLKRFLLKAGHEVEDPDHFFMEDENYKLLFENRKK